MPKLIISSLILESDHQTGGSKAATQRYKSFGMDCHTCGTLWGLPVGVDHLDATGVGVQVSGGDDHHVMARVLVGSTDGLVAQSRPVDVIDEEG